MDALAAAAGVGESPFSERSLRFCDDFERSKICCAAAAGSWSARQQREQRCAAMRPLRLQNWVEPQVRLRVFSAAQNDKLVFYVYV